jgi:hypothetical protein
MKVYGKIEANLRAFLKSVDFLQFSPRKEGPVPTAYDAG